MLPLASFASKTYSNDECLAFMPKESSQKPFDIDDALLAKMHKAISIIQFKLEEEVIKRNPQYNMKSRKLLSTIDLKDVTVDIEGTKHVLKDKKFPTVDQKNPTKLTIENNML